MLTNTYMTDFTYNNIPLTIYGWTANEVLKLVPASPNWHGEVWIEERVDTKTFGRVGAYPLVPKYISDALTIFIDCGGIAGLTIQEYIDMIEP